MQNIFTLLESILKALVDKPFFFHIIIMAVIGYLFYLIYRFKR